VRQRADQPVPQHRLRPFAAGLQTGFCQETGGGWGTALVAHPTQLHAVPDGLDDQAAVMVEPAACALHGALSNQSAEEKIAVVIGAGTLGLCTVAAISKFRDDIETVIAVAKHPEQRRLARELGATTVVEPSELRRAVRRRTGSHMLDTGQLTGGAALVFDCVGSSESLTDSLAVTEPGGTVVLLGMPGSVHVDMTGLWQREVSIRGAYAYGTERVNDQERRTFRPVLRTGRRRRPRAPRLGDVPARTLPGRHRTRRHRWTTRRRQGRLRPA